MDNNNYTSAWDGINELVSDIDGWTPIDQLFSIYLAGIFTEGLEGDFLEIGSWCGRSSVVLAKAAQKVGASLHCVDLFPAKEDWYENEDHTYSFAVNINGKKYGGYGTQTVWKQPFQRDILTLYDKHKKGTKEIFLDNVERKGYRPIVNVCHGDSKLFSESFSGKLRVAFIDGDHSYEATTEDINIVEKYLVKGGYVLFDDAFSYYEGVNQAIIDKIINSGKYEVMQQLTRKCFLARKK